MCSTLSITFWGSKGNKLGRELLQVLYRTVQEDWGFPLKQFRVLAYLCIKKKKWSNYNKTTPHLEPEWGWSSKNTKGIDAEITRLKVLTTARTHYCPTRPRSRAASPLAPANRQRSASSWKACSALWRLGTDPSKMQLFWCFHKIHAPSIMRKMYCIEPLGQIYRSIETWGVRHLPDTYGSPGLHLLTYQIYS